MKSNHLILPVLLAISSSAFAWPFVERTGFFDYVLQGNYDGTLRQHLAIQTDTDRPLEMFAGGLLLQQTAADQFGNLVHTNVSLPQPDTNPYATNNPEVSFESGHGDAGDIDGDGDTDLVYSALLRYGNLTTATEEENVRILSVRNNGNGTWTRIWQLLDVNAPTAGAPEIKLADLDRDGDLDLIETYNGLRVRWNPGDGNFNGAPTVLRSTVFPHVPNLEVADFDGNGWPDIVIMAMVVLNPSQPFNVTGRIELLSNTAGVFTTSVVPSTPGRQDYGPSAVADLNGDAKPDLVTMQSAPVGREMVWRRNTGSGFAAPVVVYSTPNADPVFIPGDVNEDGITDIVFSPTPDEVQWLRGQGNGVFAAAAVLIAPAPNAVITGYENLCLADRDGDGDVDITMFGCFYENLAPHKMSAAEVEQWSGTNPSGAVDLTVGDVNNDGKNDLIAADGGGLRLRWYPGNGAGIGTAQAISTGNLLPQSVTAGDFNGDGWTDLAWTTTDTLRQALSVNGGGLSWTFSTAATMSGITSILADDMDRDGDTDILSASPTAGILRIHSNNGIATSWSPQNVDTGIAGISTITTGPLVPGGHPEIVSLGSTIVTSHRYNAGWNEVGLANPSLGTASRAVVVMDLDVNLPGVETIFSLNGNKIFRDHDSLAAPLLLADTTAPVKQLAAADWNADGRNDLLVATAGGVDLYPNNGGAAQILAIPIPLLTGASIQDLIVMELNNDGFPDAVAVDSTGQLHLIYNRSASVKVAVSTPPTQTVLPGSFAPAAYPSGSYTPLGAPLPTAAVSAPSSVRLRFLRSTPVSGNDAPGTVLTDAEASALLESVSVIKNGTTLHTAAASTFFGNFATTLPAAARQALAMASNQASFEIRLKLKSTAADSAITRFYVEYNPASPWVAQDAAGNGDSTNLRVCEGSIAAPTLFVLSSPSALDNWRFIHFNTYDESGNAGNSADPNGNGNPNLVDYVMGQSPVTAGGTGSGAAVVLTSQGPNLPMLAELRLLNTYDSKVRLTLQSSTGLNVWATLGQRTGTGAWTVTTPTGIPLSGGRTRFVFNTGAAPASTPRYFLRLVAEELE